MGLECPADPTRPFNTTTGHRSDWRSFQTSRLAASSGLSSTGGYAAVAEVDGRLAGCVLPSSMTIL
jgi:hypothetical protein